MDYLDRQIKRIARKTEFEISEEYEQQIDNLLEQIVQENDRLKDKYNIKGKMSVRSLRYALCCLAVILFVSGSAIAAVDYVKNRMSQMNTEQQKQYRETVESTNPKTEGVIYSREMNDDEQQRYATLFEKYEQEGLFPAGEVTITDSIEDMDNIENTGIVYENKTRTFYLPERTLSDEELLSIIDFYHKVDYSLQQSDETKKVKERQKELENALPAQEAISDEQARQLASQYIKAMFGVESDNIVVDYGETEESIGDGDYTCSYTEGKTTYSVVLQASSAKLITIGKEEADADYYAEASMIDRDTFIARAQEAKRLFYCIYGEDTEIASIECSYRKDENNQVPYGNVLYYIEFPDGSAGRFSYNIKRDEFWQMINYPGYREEKELEKQGIREAEPDRVKIQIE